MNKIETGKEFEFNPLIQPKLLEFFSTAALPHFNPQELFSKSHAHIFQSAPINTDKNLYSALKYTSHSKSDSFAKSSNTLENDNFAVSEESTTTKSSEGSKTSQIKKVGMSQKKSYKKAPQGKMEEDDEQLLLSLASKYKHDWKKVSKKIFKLHRKKLGPNLLRIRYKELAPDLTQKRVRFTHAEDLRIIKYYSMYGYDWEKISSHFESRTAIMVKNRFYHIKKKNILEKLMDEVERIKEEVPSPISGDEEDLMLPGLEEHQSFSEIKEEDSFQFFVEKGEQIITKTVNIPNIDNYFDFEQKEDQLFEKITPMESSFSERMFEDDVFRMPNTWNSNPYFLL
jgi:hypothetical protein